MRKYVVQRNYDFSHREAFSMQRIDKKLSKWIYGGLAVIITLLLGSYLLEESQTYSERQRVVKQIVLHLGNRDAETDLQFYRILIHSNFSNEELKKMPEYTKDFRTLVRAEDITSPTPKIQYPQYSRHKLIPCTDAKDCEEVDSHGK
jgi:hypothetical protein